MPALNVPPLRPELINKTRRYARLARFDAYYHSTQYEGRPSFWTGQKPNGEVVPLRERAPCVVYPLPKACVNQAVRFTLGEGRFPDIKVEPGPSAVLSNPAALSRTDAEILTAYLKEVVDQALLRSKARTLMRRGLTSGTAVAIVSLVRGVFQIDMPHACDCWPTFRDDRVGEVTRLTSCYEYDRLVPRADGLEYKRSWYRRDVDEDGDYAYLPVDVGPLQEVVEWSIDEANSVSSRLGFCPAVWIRNLQDEYGGEIDGVSLFDGLLDEFDSLNFALSQRHRGIVFFGVPQPWEVGVDKDDGPQATGRTALDLREDATVDPFRVVPKAARPAGPDRVWSYESDKARVGLIETTGASFKAATDHVLDIRERLLEAMDIVLLDQMKVTGSGDISAKALALLFAPLLALVDELRDCWWEQALRPILSMALRITEATGGRGILAPGAEDAARVLRAFRGTDDAAWLIPRIRPLWGDYFSPLNSEVQQAVQTANEASGKLISRKTAVGYVAGYFGVTDVQAELEDIEEEAQRPEQPAVVPEPKPPQDAVGQLEPVVDAASAAVGA